MSLALATLEESLSAALLERGHAVSKPDVQFVAQAVADWLDMLAEEEQARAEAWEVSIGSAQVLAPYWSRKTLLGLALMLRRGR